MAILKGVKAYHTYSEFSGYLVPLEMVINEISQLPLDGVLGLIASLSLDMLQFREKFDSPEFQGEYLNYALIDDFPRSIPGVPEMIIPGRVPITGGRHTFMHEQNLSWLCHYALLHSNRESSTSVITHGLKRRILRLLLIINDLLMVDSGKELGTLMERRAFAQSWVRHYHFNRFWRHPIEFYYKLARQKVLFLDFLPKYFPDLDSHFIKAMGISLHRYFEIVALFVSLSYSVMGPNNQWLSKITLSSQVRANRDEIDCLLAQWTRTPEQYDDFCRKWKWEQPDTGLSAIYDFVPLRMTPIIEARPDQLVCPIPVFLFAKIEDEPYYILSEHLVDKELTDFHKAIGDAYEDYANGLVERIANADLQGKWKVRRSPFHENSQLADTYMQRGRVAILFEHKALRPGSEFLRGGEGERVIGPSDSILTRLENQEKVSLKEGRYQDKGLLTRGMWQQSKAGPKIIHWAEKEVGERPTRLIPIITHLSTVRVDEIVRLAYIDPLIKKALLYKDDFWIQPQWLHISEMEAMARMAEDGELDIESLLDMKNVHHVQESFDLFINDHCGGLKMDKALYDSALSLLKGASATFFPK